MEVFAGEAGLSQAVSARGMQILPPIEIVINNFVKEKVDILDPAVFQHLRLLIQEGIVIFIHFGTPCSSFSIARKHDGGPPPLRDRQQVWGRPGLSRHDREKLLLGNTFMALTAALATLCYDRGILWSIENPASSFLWRMPPVQALAALPGVKQFLLDMCRFGAPHKKPTALLSSADLSPLALECDMAVRPHVHEPLVGTVMIANEQVFKTKLAQVYPPALCRAWAGLIAPGDTDPLAPTFSMVTRPEDRKRPIGQALPWKPHKQQITAEKASAAGYQLKRAALPPLLPVEMEPGQAVKAALEVRHPFTIEPVLEPDLQEALALHSTLIGFLDIALVLYVIGQLALRCFCPRRRPSSTRCQIRTCVSFFAEHMIIKRLSWAKSHTLLCGEKWCRRLSALIRHCRLISCKVSLSLDQFNNLGGGHRSWPWRNFFQLMLCLLGPGSSPNWSSRMLTDARSQRTPRRSGRPRSRTCRKAHVLGLCSRSRKWINLLGQSVGSRRKDLK